MKSVTEQTFLEAFDAYADALFRHAVYRISDRERARDLVQDAFLKAWDYLREGGDIRSYKSFLYRILHNLIIDEYRRKSSYSLDELLENEATSSATEALLAQGDRREVEEALDDALEVGRIHETMLQLPEHHRLMITMRFVDGLSIEEIAETIGISQNAVSVRVHRAVLALRALYTSLYT